MGDTFSNLAEVSIARSDWPAAAARMNNAGAVFLRRMKRSETNSAVENSSTTNELGRFAGYFLGLIKASGRIAPKTLPLDNKLGSEMFEAAQWAQSSEAGSSLAQMASRSAAGNPKLAGLVRERQDLTAEWQATDKRLIASKSDGPEKRNPENEKRLADRLNSIDTRLAEIVAKFSRDFPGYAALIGRKPSSIADIQTQLRDNEALILFLDTSDGFKPMPEETFIWAVTKTDSRWVWSDLGTRALNERVAALRCGLDSSEWSAVGTEKCAAALGLDKNAKKPNPLPFDTGKANELYRGLFGAIEDLLVNADGTGKSLLLVPSGALTALPFQVLVTKAAVKSASYDRVEWLAKRHALTVLPSVSSLAALRSNAKSSNAPEPFIAFANPVLKLDCGSTFIPDSCPQDAITVAAAGSEVSRSDNGFGATGSFFRSGLADVKALKSRLCPLPDTAFEVGCVAKSLGANDDSLVLGKAMTETSVKQMKLDRYRVVHFATHGLLAGETSQLAKDRAEPALVFTPPDIATEKDDGLLTASEVAGLKLDADWVIMSACNTAAGGTPGAEALSGLAKAFFYAGARALLVSHWPVNSYAATMLTSQTFAELKKEPAIGRSEAFRRAMLAVMNDPNRPSNAHPSVWAPFVVVGEGGASLPP